MVSRPIHMHLSMESVNQEKLLATMQNMQITYIESVIAANELSGDELCHVIDLVRSRMETSLRKHGDG